MCVSEAEIPEDGISASRRPFHMPPFTWQPSSPRQLAVSPSFLRLAAQGSQSMARNPLPCRPSPRRPMLNCISVAYSGSPTEFFFLSRHCGGQTRTASGGVGNNFSWAPPSDVWQALDSCLDDTPGFCIPDKANKPLHRAHGNNSQSRRPFYVRSRSSHSKHTWELVRLLNPDKGLPRGTVLNLGHDLSLCSWSTKR